MPQLTDKDGEVVATDATIQSTSSSDEENKRFSVTQRSNCEEIRPADDDEQIHTSSKLEEKDGDADEENVTSTMDMKEDEITEKKRNIMRTIYHWVMKDDDKCRDSEFGKDLLDKKHGVASATLENGDIEDEHVKFEEKYSDDEAAETAPTSLQWACRAARNKSTLVGAIATLLLLIIIVIILCVAFGKGPAEDNAKADCITNTSTHCGPIQGRAEDGAVVFLGVPYAMAPIGDRRWRPSVMASSLEQCWQGVYLAHNRSALCYQKPLPQTFGDIRYSEDCLYLDIYTPEVTCATPRPVVLYFAGDSFQGHDESDITWRPSAALAREKEVVFVVVNYRMNAFGFLALELLTRNVHPPTSGNYGLHDMVTALEWVNDNIEHFGGNPAKVTLLGHGSGATGIMALMSYHKTKLMFTQAWMTGGSASFVNKTLRDVERDNEAFNRHLVCDTAECLYGKSADLILSAVPYSEWPYWGDPNYLDLPTSDEHTAAIAVVDGEYGYAQGDARKVMHAMEGDIVYDTPIAMWENNNFNDVAFVVGSSIHAVGARPLFDDFENWNFTKYFSHVRHRLNTFGSTLANEAIEMYNYSTRTPQEQYIEMVSDLRVTCPLLQLAYKASKIFTNHVYSYIMEYVPDGFVKHVAHGQKMAVHGLDVIAIFGKLKEHVHNPSQRDLDFEKQMQKIFYEFVYTGKVSANDKPATFNPKMPWYVNRIGDELVTQVWPYPNCEFWTNNGMYPKHGRKN